MLGEKPSRLAPPPHAGHALPCGLKSETIPFMSVEAMCRTATVTHFLTGTVTGYGCQLQARNEHCAHWTENLLKCRAGGAKRATRDPHAGATDNDMRATVDDGEDNRAPSEIPNGITQKMTPNPCFNGEENDENEHHLSSAVHKFSSLSPTSRRRGPNGKKGHETSNGLTGALSGRVLEVAFPPIPSTG